MHTELLHDIAMSTERAVLPEVAVRSVLERLSTVLRGPSLLALITPTGPHLTTLAGKNAETRFQGGWPQIEGLLKVITEQNKSIAGHKLPDQEDVFSGTPVCWNGEVIGALCVECLSNVDEELQLLLEISAALIAHSAETCRHARPTGEHLSGSVRLPGFIGNSEAMLKVYEQIAQVASSPTTVLLRGESGTGKELAAKAIHRGSSRAEKPFVSLNCAALPENLIESELFGHEKGAFTGAAAIRKGRFELADGGTLFLDEVGELSMLTQAKLLRVIQERRFERLGAMESRQVDVRIITATNQNLEAMVEGGTFRRDLYYRLNVFPIIMPPLRERQSDILPLASHFLRTFAAANGRGGMSLSRNVMETLQNWSWPGNIRELENVIERAVLVAGQGGVIELHHLPLEMQDTLQKQQNTVPFADENMPLQEQLDALEKQRIVAALNRFHGHMGHAAEALGLTERVMALRMKKHGITYKTFRRREEEKSTD